MKNIIEFDGHKATVSFDMSNGMFRGEFIDLAGGADFYADTVEKLLAEGRMSLSVYFEVRREYGIASCA